MVPAAKAQHTAQFDTDGDVNSFPQSLVIKQSIGQENNIDLMLLLEEKGTTKIATISPQVDMTVCAKIHENPSQIC